MIFRQLTASGDWTFGAGKANFAAGDQAIGLNIRTRLLSWVNDCFFDMPMGIDWSNLLGSKNQREILEQNLRKLLLESFGVTSIIKFDTILADRKFSAVYNITTIFSPSFQNSIEIGF